MASASHSTCDTLAAIDVTDAPCAPLSVSITCLMSHGIDCWNALTASRLAMPNPTCTRHGPRCRRRPGATAPRRMRVELT
jgi:hypothetical protein